MHSIILVIWEYYQLSIVNCHAIGIGIANEQFGILADCELKLVSNWQIVGCTVAAP